MGLITMNINVANKNFSDRLVFREDIITVIKELDNAKPDAAPSKKSTLNKLFRAYGVECGRDMNAEQYWELLESNSIPSISILPEFCWDEMVKLYRNYKHPKDFMERIVNNLVASEYDTKGTSVRLKMLKQFLGKLNYLKGTRLYDKKLEEIILEKYDGVIENITEDIFDKDCMPARHSTEPHKMLEAIIEVYKKILFKENEYDEKLSSMLYRYKTDLEIITGDFARIKIEEKTALELLNYVYQYNRRDRIEKKSYYVINASLPKLIEEISGYLEKRLGDKLIELDCLISQLEDKKKNRKEQFEDIRQTIAQCDYDWCFVDKEFKMFISKHLGIYIEQNISNNVAIDQIVKELEKSPKKFAKVNDFIIKSLKQYRSLKKKSFEEAKDRGRDKSSTIEILHICNDLSKGLFKKSQGEMKEILYYLAFAFGMTVLDDNYLENADFNRNVTVQLFENFYCNNIIRYLKDYKRNGIYEEPVGVPIRYNNFVELVYLYWLNKSDEEYSRYQKLTNAINMINDIRKMKNNAWKKTLSLKTTGKKYKEAVAIAYNKEHPSIKFERYFYGKGTGEQFSEETTKQLLRLPVKDFQSVLLKEFDIDEQYHYSGRKSYEGFYNQMKLRTAEDVLQEFLCDIREDSYYEFEKMWLLQPEYVSLHTNTVEEDADSIALKKLIKKVNERIEGYINSDNKQITRTDILIAYCLKFVSENMDYEQSFVDFYKDYTEELNDLLRKSSFQVFSEKNLLDILLLYSSFMAVRVSFEI